jgi:hypothetical protein
MPRGFLSLVFIDPEGVSGLDADTMRVLADQRLSVDLIVLFPQGMSVNRNRWQWTGSAGDTPLDRVLDGRERRTNTTPEVVQFMELLRELGVHIRGERPTSLQEPARRAALLLVRQQVRHGGRLLGEDQPRRRAAHAVLIGHLVPGSSIEQPSSAGRSRPAPRLVEERDSGVTASVAQLAQPLEASGFGRHRCPSRSTSARDGAPADSPPVISHVMPCRLSSRIGPSSGSALTNRTRTSTSRKRSTRHAKRMDSTDTPSQTFEGNGSARARVQASIRSARFVRTWKTCWV